jgi:hypothetical protein
VILEKTAFNIEEHSVDESTKEVIVASLTDYGCDLAFDLGLIRYELFADCLLQITFVLFPIYH